MGLSAFTEYGLIYTDIIRTDIRLIEFAHTYTDIKDLARGHTSAQEPKGKPHK